MLARPRPDRSKGYLWAVYPGYDIIHGYGRWQDRKEAKAAAPRYDAEATVNWKTGKIVYIPWNRGDIDLWTMKSDGSAKKQITSTEGYDGGAVFSRDGKKLVWRANHPSTPETRQEIPRVA